MSHKIRYRLLSLNARLLRNVLVMIGMAGFLAACSGGDKKEKPVNQDSLNKAKEQQQLDSARKALQDSLDDLKAREDSIANLIGKPDPQPVITKYGVPDDFYDDPRPTKYGPPADYNVQ